MKATLSVLPVAAALLVLAGPAFAQEAANPAFHANTGAGIAMGLAVLGGGLGQGMAARACSRACRATRRPRRS